MSLALLALDAPLLSLAVAARFARMYLFFFFFFLPSCPPSRCLKKRATIPSSFSCSGTILQRTASPSAEAPPFLLGCSVFAFPSTCHANLSRRMCVKGSCMGNSVCAMPRPGGSLRTSWFFCRPKNYLIPWCDTYQVRLTTTTLALSPCLEVLFSTTKFDFLISFRLPCFRLSQVSRLG